jgi:hypothetical protein
MHPHQKVKTQFERENIKTKFELLKLKMTIYKNLQSTINEQNAMLALMNDFLIGSFHVHMF